MNELLIFTNIITCNRYTKVAWHDVVAATVT